MNLHLYTVHKLRIVADPSLVDEILRSLATHDLGDVTIIDAKGRSGQGAVEFEKRKVIEILLPERQINDVMGAMRTFFARRQHILFYLEEVRVLRREHLQ